MNRGRSERKETHPREKANIFSSLSFFYIIKLFKKGYTKGLEADDIYEVLPKCRSKGLGDRLERCWQDEKSKHKKPSLSRALCYCFGRSFITLGLIQLVANLTITIWSPQVQSKLISYFSPNQTEISGSDANYYACAVIGLSIFNLFFTHNFNLYVLALALSAKAAVVSVIYRKSLRLSSGALSKVTVGKITTVLNKDAEVIQVFVSIANDLWIALVKTGMICYLIYNKIGIASWAGVTFFFVVLPLQMFIGKLTYNFRLECNKKTDERLEITEEVLSAIKNIKMYTWEAYFEKKICDARKEELKKMVHLFYARVWISVIGSFSSKVAFFIFLVTYVWMNNNVTAEIVYYMLSCFGDLETSLNITIPHGFSQAAETYAVVKRCEAILMAEEISIKKTQEISQNSLVDPGLYIVVGNTGSGKSTFLKSNLETSSGRISYASQEPWLFPSTIKNNILFGEEYCEERYQEVLRTCSLDYDLNLIEGSDSMVVGEHGINLSKGQQARVNLARAIYRNSDVYLLDDCLASLDGRVSDHIFQECIGEFLKGKICLFVTNNDYYRRRADYIITVNRNSVKCDANVGKIVFKSTTTRGTEEASKDNATEQTGIYQEKKNAGKVKLGDYCKYVSYGGGVIVFAFIMMLFIASQGAYSYTEKLMSHWVTLEQNFTNVMAGNQTYTPEFQKLYEDKTESLTVYCVIFVASTFLQLISSVLYFIFLKTASRNLHQAMLRSIINSKMTFFDCNFIGNILTRFSKDCWTADESVPFFLLGCFTMTFEICGAIILLTTVSTVFLIESCILILIAYFIKRFCQPTGRNLQRLHVIARSPMVGHVNSTLAGLTTIRASGAEDIVIEEFDKHQDLFTSAHYMLDNSLLALSFSLELFCALFIALVILQILLTDSGTTVGDVGLAITQAFSITFTITNGFRIVSDCENLMTSVERMLEYVSLECEDRAGTVMENWPENGAISFNHVTLNYGTTKTMLQDLNLSMESRAKMGIIGRTGAGKSSIIWSLLRLYPTQGHITIDGFDIQTLSLSSLRSNVSVMPQDPFLFSGTIRENLDPLKLYTDERIWEVLSQLRLKTTFKDLDWKIDKGTSLSTGQKQLLCLARVILRKNKIVILDEATASVDKETDALIREAVWKNFANCTVIVIAHKLLSIMSCDKVVVLSDGQVQEVGEPSKLLQNENSFIHAVVK